MSIKRTNIKNTLVIIFCGLLIYGCKKNSDYRNKFVGDYNFVIHNSWYYGWPPNVTSGDTTYSYDGKIEISSDKNSVLISSSSFSMQATIYEDGTLEGYLNNNGRGEFSSTKEMKYSWGNYSPGGSSTYNITGEKE